MAFTHEAAQAELDRLFPDRVAQREAVRVAGGVCGTAHYVYRCTLPKLHRGLHAAHSSLGKVLQRWSDYLCDDCKQDVQAEFHVDAKLWHAVIDSKDIEHGLDGYDGGEGYLCLSCFAVRAHKKGVLSFVVRDITPTKE